MTLSGWTRLWIVGAVIWWSAGAWWLVQEFRPERVVDFSIEPQPKIHSIHELKALAREEETKRRFEERRIERQTALERGDFAALEKLIGELPNDPPIINNSWAAGEYDAFEPGPYRDDWTLWYLRLAGVVIAPFAAAAAFVAARAVTFWIWGGFKKP